MQEYGSTQMRGQPEHVVYVSVGGASRQRFGENKMGKMAMAALGMTLVACLVFSAATEERHYSAYTPSVGLAQRKVMQGDIVKMEMQLAAKEVHHKMMLEATKNLSPEVKAVASKLAQAVPTSQLVDCTKTDAYLVLQTAFAGLTTNITTENATIYAQDAKLYSEHVTAKAAWMKSDSAFRNAEFDHESAKEAAVYAKTMYDKYFAEVDEGQADYNTQEPTYSAEKSELVAQQPILQQVKTLVANMAATSEAKGKMQFLKALPALKKLANSVVPPRMSKDKSIAKKVYALRTSLVETETSGTVSTMLVLINQIIDTMSKRIIHIDTTLSELSMDLASSKTSLTEWEVKLVSLSDDKDKAENHMNTADLARNQLNGVHVVKEEAYDNYHSAFVDEAEKYAQQLKAISTIGAKIDEAITSCAA